MIVENVQASSCQRLANRHAAPGHLLRGQRAAIMDARHHGGFGRAIGIEQAYMPEPGLVPQAQTLDGHGFAADMHLA